MNNNSLYENQEEIVNPQVKSPTPRIFLLAIIGLGCLIIAGVYFNLFSFLLKRKKVTPGYTPTPTPYAQTTPFSSPFFYSKPPVVPSPLGFELTQIAYIKGQDIWLIKGSGSDKIRLPKESHLISFFVLNFKDEKNLSYTKCQDSCGIYNYNLENNQEVLIAEPGTATGYTRIEAFDQTTDGKYLSFFYIPPDGKTYLALKTPSSSTVLKELGETFKKGENLNDQIKICFSENEEKFLAINNTLKSTDIPFVFLFEKNGEEIENKSLNDLQKSDFPLFFDDIGETIIYKYNDLLYKKEVKKLIVKGKESLKIKTEKLTSLKDSYEFSLSPNKQKLAYFKYTEEEKIELFTYDFESDLHEKIADDLKNPHWLDDQYLLVGKVAYCEEKEEGCNNFGFKKIGLSIVDIEKKKIISDVLLEENIYTLAVSP